MAILKSLPEIIKNAEAEYLRLRAQPEDSILSTDAGRSAIDADSTVASGLAAGTLVEGLRDYGGSLFHGDNLKVLTTWLRLKEKGNLPGADLIYCDPPFFTRVDQGARIPVSSEVCPDIKALRLKAYNDRFDGDMGAYLAMLTPRLMLMRDLLAETGSIFIHLDWHAVHVVKLLMDEIFGEDAFVNEIIWTYKSGGADSRHFARKHDTILFYGKSGDYKFFPQKEKSYNRGFKPYRFKGVEEFEDQLGWYTMVNMKDVWQIDMVGRSSSERVNYATQKPEALIKRIIEAVTEPGDICADFFCGSGTLPVTAGALGRRFVASDISGLAISNTLLRLDRKGLYPLVALEQKCKLETSETPNDIEAACESVALGSPCDSAVTGKPAGPGISIDSEAAEKSENPEAHNIRRADLPLYQRLLSEDPDALKAHELDVNTYTSSGVEKKRLAFDIFGNYK